ncbi:hypothetical protein BKA82DRAFT_291379 [Pisolithus tinctorius]|uniref:Uncharacterized protein n=1 Tax=Pisolithus tinctorius Marx 270 TaxID=870435 RepID=A0A0C3NCU3_PISTI|nr:hypothetical protein BKA82DRAFT_291379 [Pisolithus tinctorius]KIN93670.1 hypothetical protein M404DRAFT_486486 [Pisolithus tinctorius Marx 270]KIN96050.1 hypothetical protein M404DRAFT_291379 [Pisolithus tinctorius Marx 270]
MLKEVLSTGRRVLLTGSFPDLGYFYSAVSLKKFVLYFSTSVENDHLPRAITTFRFIAVVASQVDNLCFRISRVMHRDLRIASPSILIHTILMGKGRNTRRVCSHSLYINCRPRTEGTTGTHPMEERWRLAETRYEIDVLRGSDKTWRPGDVFRGGKRTYELVKTDSFPVLQADAWFMDRCLSEFRSTGELTQAMFDAAEGRSPA